MISQISPKNRLLLREALHEAIFAGAQIATRWSVITGAPGSGKSTLIAYLHSLGHCIVEDPARKILEERVQAGFSKHQARTNYGSMQDEILRRMEDSANALNPQERVFFDYALPDNLAFLTISGLEWTQKHLQAACRFRYQYVFLLDILDTTPNGDLDPVRLETTEQRRSIYELLREIYTELGVTLTRIPSGDVHERANMLLQKALVN